MTELTVSFRNFSNAPKKLYILPAMCVDAFCMDLKINSDHFPTPNKLSDFYNQKLKCLPRGTTSVFKYNGG
jgi:hypothetical protein